MIWDFLNTVIAAALAFWNTSASILGTSPLYISTSQLADIATPLGYAAWALPVQPMAIIMAAYVGGVIVLLGILVMVNLIENIVP